MENKELIFKQSFQEIWLAKTFEKSPSKIWVL